MNEISASALPLMRLNVPVQVLSGPQSRQRFDAFHSSLESCGYMPSKKDGGDSIWLGGVCVAECLGEEFYVYPAAFARYG